MRRGRPGLPIEQRQMRVGWSFRWARYAAVAAAPAVCAAAGDLQFVEQGLERGLTYEANGLVSNGGFGICLADLDDDGDDDLVAVGRSDGVVGVFENVGGMFVDRTDGTGLPTLVFPSSVLAADFDGDGRRDLYLTCIGCENVLARNLGNWRFADVTTASGAGDNGPSVSAAVADVDGDGWLDLFVANYGGPNRLLRNTGDGRFAPLPVDTLGLDERTYQGVFFDDDLDGDPDLYITNDRRLVANGQFNRLYRNEGGALIDVSAGSGADVSTYSMGVSAGDLNRDGRCDLYVSTWHIEPNPLLMRAEEGFVESSAAAGMESWRFGWGVLLADLDLDGWRDALVCNVDGPMQLYRGGATWPALEVALSAGLGELPSTYCVAASDVDDDGDLDLVVQAPRTRLRLYMNNSVRSGNWLKLRVRGPAAMREVIGARVEISGAQPPQAAEVTGGGAVFKGQNGAALHFGVGAATTVQLRLTCRDGETRDFMNVPVNRAWTLVPNALAGDYDGDGALMGADFSDFWRCRSDADAAPANGCELFDVDGDFVVDAADYLNLLTRLALTQTEDCDGNGFADAADILAGRATDLDYNAVPDDCECLGDLSGDRRVDYRDLGMMLAAYGGLSTLGDLNRDAHTDVDDLELLLGRYLATCP